MIRPVADGPRARLRPGTARRRARWRRRACAGAAWLVLALAPWASAQAAPPAAPRCGDAAGVGLLIAGGLEDDAVRVAWTLVAAPAPTLVARPLVFVDGRLAADLGPVTFPCGAEVVRTVPVRGARDAVHWTLHGWPPVPSALAILSFEEATRAFAARLPPGTFAMADVGLVRPPGGRPWPVPSAAADGVGPARDPAGGPPGDPVGGPAHDPAAAAADARGEGDVALVDDAVTVRPPTAPAGAAPPWRALAAGGRLVRTVVGADVPIQLTYAAPDDGRVLATCLLDGVQVPAFDGAPAVAARLAAGARLVVDGRVRVARAGWQRLHCLLLPDDADPSTPTPPRPLLALYLWGDPP